MINDLLAFAIDFAAGLTIGFQMVKIRQDVSIIKDSLLARKEASPAVVSGNPTLSRPERVNASAVISPKSPQLIEFEENEELRRMNPGS
jgi:hypothetical protein